MATLQVIMESMVASDAPVQTGDFLTPQPLAWTVVDVAARESVSTRPTSLSSAASLPTTHTASVCGDDLSETPDSSSTAASNPASSASSAGAATAASAPRC